MSWYGTGTLTLGCSGKPDIPLDDAIVVRFSDNPLLSYLAIQPDGGSDPFVWKVLRRMIVEYLPRMIRELATSGNPSVIAATATIEEPGKIQFSYEMLPFLCWSDLPEEEELDEEIANVKPIREVA